MRANLTSVIAVGIGMLTSCTRPSSDRLAQQIDMEAPDGGTTDDGGGGGMPPDASQPPPGKLDLDPLQEPPEFGDYPDDEVPCYAQTSPPEPTPVPEPTSTTALKLALTSSTATTTSTCGQCDTDEHGEIVDPYCTGYGDPDTGASSDCSGSDSASIGFVSCLGPSAEETKTHLLPSEHTTAIKEIFYAYPVSPSRSVFATLPAASTAQLPANAARPRISQLGIRNFILRSITAATGRRTEDRGARDHAATDLVQVTVVTNDVTTARTHIINHLKRPRSEGGLGLSQTDAEAVVGPATEAAYRGAGKIRLASVPNLTTVWIRDFGPHILQLRAGGTKNGEQVIMDFGYHGDRPSDDAVPSRLFGLRATLWPGATLGYIDANRGDAQLRSGAPLANTSWTANGTPGPTNGLKDEGGNLASDGHGSCLTTWKNLQPNGDAGGFQGYYEANGEMTAAQQRTRLKQLLGCDHVTVLPRLPYHYDTTSRVATGDGTGHVDMLAHFYGRDKILLAESEKGDDNCNDYPNTFIGQFNKRTCLALRAAKAELLRVGYQAADIKRVPILDYTTDLRSARSTTNLMEVGNRVLYVTYDSMTAEQKTALRNTLIDAYGNTRQLFELDATTIIESGGAAHCTSIGFQEL